MPGPAAPVTFDTNRLRYPAQRRLNAAWMELRCEPVRILPQVAEQLTHGRFDVINIDELPEQLQSAEARLKQSHDRLNPGERVARRTDIRWVRELLADGSPYEPVSFTGLLPSGSTAGP